MASRKANHTPLILGTAALLGLGALAASNSSAVTEAIDDAQDWFASIINRVSHHEGGYDSLNKNVDGAGLSFGILQWAQQPGSLGVLLNAMYEADRSRFARTFGPAHRELLKVTAKGSLEPVNGAVLWKSPWTDRFRQAGRDPVFQAVQNRLAAGGPYFQAALKCADILGIRTERSLALFMDAAVQQGPGTATKIAKRISNWAVGPFSSQKELHLKILGTFAMECSAPFIRGEPPTRKHPHFPRLKWVQVGPSEWNVFAGKFNLYTDISRRRMGIVNDFELSDAPIHLAVA